jgi:hypothetical protein
MLLAKVNPACHTPKRLLSPYAKSFLGESCHWTLKHASYIANNISHANHSLHDTYAPADIAKATKELISILQDDEVLSTLYAHAVADVNIGPKKLERNLRKFFKEYSEQLGSEAGDTLEFLASQLVRIKAHALARTIIRRYVTDYAVSYQLESSNLAERHEQSSDDEVESQPVNEDVLQNLDILRHFLTAGEAFQLLQKQIRSFVMPTASKEKLAKQTNEGHVTNTVLAAPAAYQDDGVTTTMVGENSRAQTGCRVALTVADMDYQTGRDRPISRLVWEFGQSLSNLLFLVEPPIQPGFTRLKWRCVS